jgi:hypothetical protein
VKCMSNEFSFKREMADAECEDDALLHLRSVNHVSGRFETAKGMSHRRVTWKQWRRCVSPSSSEKCSLLEGAFHLLAMMKG